MNVKGTLGMAGTRLPIFAQSEHLWQDLYSRNIHPNWQRSEKTRGMGRENTHKKLSCEQKPLYLSCNIPLRLLYRSPPLATLTSHLTKTTTTASKEGNDQMDEGRSFFFPPTHRFCDLSRYNGLNVIQHCSVFSLCLLCKKKNLRFILF